MKFFQCLKSFFDDIHRIRDDLDFIREQLVRLFPDKKFTGFPFWK